MVCIYCSAKTQVINSRLQKRSNSVWRRRQCLHCQAIFTTAEAANYGAAWRVSSPNMALQPFQRDKLLISTYNSCRHRPDAIGDAGALADTTIKKLQPQLADGVLTTKLIQEKTLETLQLFDSVAAVHYQAFHRA